MKKSRVLFLFVLVSFYPSLVFAQSNSLTLTTYYPSPFGIYRKLSITNSAQFTPLAAPPSACTTSAEAGTMYVDTTGDLRVCDGTKWSSNGIWVDNSTTFNVYPRNYTNRNVGVGISAPTTRLEVSKDITGGATWASMFTSNPFGSQLTLSDTTGRLYLGNFYNPGIATMGVLQASDYYSAADHWAPLLLNPRGGSVGIGVTYPGATLDVNGVIHSSSEINACGGGACSHLRYTGDNRNYLRGQTLFDNALIDENNGNFYLDPNNNSILNTMNLMNFAPATTRTDMGPGYISVKKDINGDGAWSTGSENVIISDGAIIAGKYRCQWIDSIQMVEDVEFRISGSGPGAPGCSAGYVGVGANTAGYGGGGERVCVKYRRMCVNDAF